jgi:hypothetical protein
VDENEWLLSRRRFLAASLASSLTFPRAEALGQQPLIASTMIDSHVHVWKHDSAFPFAEGAHPPTEDASVEMHCTSQDHRSEQRTVRVV